MIKTMKTKFFWLWVTALMMFAALQVLPSHAQTRYIYGDINCDSNLTVADVCELTDMILGKKNSSKDGLVVGLWRTIDGDVLDLKENNVSHYKGACSYVYIPNANVILFYNDKGTIIELKQVHEICNDYIKVSDFAETSVSIYYSSSFFVSRIILNEQDINLFEDTFFQLNARVEPESAINKKVTWVSDNENVASVDDTGKVYAISPGVAHIYVYSCDNSGTSAVCSINVQSDIHEYIDMGLPSATLWASCNIGSNNPEDYGDYLAWGETTGYLDGKTNFSWANYKWANGSATTLNKYCQQDGISRIMEEDDAAAVRWSNAWEIPSSQQMDELFDTQYSDIVWCDGNSVKYKDTETRGYLITSKSNGNSIFLPAGGIRVSNDEIDYFGSRGYYWCNTASVGTTNVGMASGRVFSSADTYVRCTTTRCYGYCIRPVKKNPSKELLPVTNIELNYNALLLQPNETYKLQATLYPSYRTDNSVRWMSSNESVVTVTQEGMIEAIGEGFATISAIAEDGNGPIAICKVSVLEVWDKTTNECKCVDLGLPSGTLWAQCNLGASSPIDHGSRYQWGELEPSSSSSLSDYCFFKSETVVNSLGIETSIQGYTKYVLNASNGFQGYCDNISTLNIEDDAAQSTWGGNWKMPSKQQLNELMNNTNISTTMFNGVKIAVITSNRNGNFILMPLGYYWSNTLFDTENALAINVTDSWKNSGYYVRKRDFNYLIRPVRK